MPVAVLWLITFLVGVSMGCVGVGGFLIIQILDIFAGLSTHSAMATALFSFIFTGIVEVFLFYRKGSMDWQLTIPCCLSFVFTSYPGALLNAYTSARTLNLILAGIIIFAGLSAIRPRKPISMQGDVSALRGRRIQIFVIGASVGFASGLVGVGRPVLSVPIMIALGFPALPTIAASQMLQIAASSSGSVGNLQNGFIDFSGAWRAISLEMAGVVAGVWLAHKASGGVLKAVVSLVCIFVGCNVLYAAW